MGSFPDGETFPESTSPNALPPMEPLNHACTNAPETSFTVVTSTGPPETMMVTSFLFAFANALASSSWPEGSVMLLRSEPSVSTSLLSPAKKSTTSAFFAAFTACAMSLGSAFWMGDFFWSRSALPKLLYPGT